MPSVTARPDPWILGSSGMIEQTGATEIMLQGISPGQEARRYSHALIADALGITGDARPATVDAA
jgi:hypothetical protein